MRTLCAARLLRRGADFESVAKLTRVPVPLLELIQAGHPLPPTNAGSTGGAGGTGRVSARRVLTLLLKAVVVLASTNLVLSLIAVINGNTVLSAATGALAVVLLMVVLVVVRRLRPSRR